MSRYSKSFESFKSLFFNLRAGRGICTHPHRGFSGDLHSAHPYIQVTCLSAYSRFYRRVSAAFAKF